MAGGEAQRLEHFTQSKDRHRIELYNQDDRAAEAARNKAAKQRAEYLKWSWWCAYIAASVVCLLLLELTPEGFMWGRPDTPINHDYRDALFYEWFYRATDPLPGEELKSWQKLGVGIAILLLMPVYLVGTTFITVLHFTPLNLKLPLLEMLNSPSSETFLTLRFLVAWGLTYFGVLKINEYYRLLVVGFWAVVIGTMVGVGVYGVLWLFELLPHPFIQDWLLNVWQVYPPKDLAKPERALILLVSFGILMWMKWPQFRPPNG